MADFEKAILKVLQNEGGYTEDSGGKTIFGISDKRDGKIDGMIDIDMDGTGDVFVRDLKLDQAKSIYKKEYWNRIRGDEYFDDTLAYNVFDLAVNAGVGTASKLIQKVVGVKQDGIIGSVTLREINNSDPDAIIDDFKKERILFYVELVKRKPEYLKYLKGWILRSFL